MSSMKEAYLDKFAEDSRLVADQALAVLLAKQLDYGPTNIINSPGGALNGLVVRLYDKIARANNLVKNNLEPTNEPLYDTFLDIANYGIIGLMVINKTFPGSE